MCYSPVRVVPRRYISNVEVKGRFIESALYDGQIYNSNVKYVYYPCGKCYECRESRIEAWQIRWKEHLKSVIDDSSYMLTLTYNDRNINTLNGKTVLCYRDVQLFLKRLRKRQEKYCRENNITNPKISYHGCGEYGTQYTKRPHYHILVTNVLVNSEEFESIWGNGLVHVGDDVTSETIKYILKYTLKGSLQNEQKESVKDSDGNFLYNIYTTGKNIGRVCEKSFCSKGIGISFLTEELVKYYHENPTMGYLYQDVKKDGTRYSKTKPLPRYYKELIFNPNNYVLSDKNRLVIERDDHGRPIKKYNPLKEGFEETPRYKKLVESYKAEQKVLSDVLSKIANVGYDQYLKNVRRDKIESIRIYESRLQKRNKRQDYLNAVNGAMLV